MCNQYQVSFPWPRTGCCSIFLRSSGTNKRGVHTFRLSQSTLYFSYLRDPDRVIQAILDFGEKHFCPLKDTFHSQIRGRQSQKLVEVLMYFRKGCGATGDTPWLAWGCRATTSCCRETQVPHDELATGVSATGSAPVAFNGSLFCFVCARNDFRS